MSARKQSKPPGGNHSLSKRTAFLLDDLIRIPGTQKRIGLDPIIGLIPGVGDFITSAAGLILLVAGIRRGVSKTVYLRMLSNWTLNALVGAIPFTGDLFSFWFKSNHRNQDLLRAHLEGDGHHTPGKLSWWPFLTLLTLVIAVFTSFGIVAWLTLRWIFA